MHRINLVPLILKHKSWMLVNTLRTGDADLRL